MELVRGGFTRRGVGFLRAGGDMLKGTSCVNSVVRVGITQVSRKNYLYNVFKRLFINICKHQV